MNNSPETFNETRSSSMGDQISQTAEDLQHRAQETWETVQEQTGHAVDESVAYVRENPVPVLIGVFALGLTIGLLSGHREPTLRERYVEEPLHESRGMLLGALVAIAALFRNLLKSASSSAEHFADKVSDIDLKGSVAPISKAARKAGKKAGLI